MINDSSTLKRSRLMYILQAAFEYLISILVTGSFLAALTKQLGISDSLTGVLSSVISLGCLFQLLSISSRAKNVKRQVIWLGIINQVLFMLLYIIPFAEFKNHIGIAVFIIFICSAYIIYNFAHPQKINWLMSVVDNRARGTFTANKEIVSLLCGMAFSYLMGAVIDRFTENGKIKIAFMISATVIFILMCLHTLSMLFTIEVKLPSLPKTDFSTSVKELFKSKNVLKITVVFVLYYISHYASVPFYGTYQINELDMSLKTVSLIVMIGNISRIAVSKFWGRYADKSSFSKMTEKCLIFLSLAQLCALFAVPSNGILMFALYYFLYGIAMGGINSALINLIFDYVPPEKRSDSLAVSQALAGLMGFLTTLALSPLISAIQKNGNTFCGLHIYAQQVCTFISLFFTLLMMFKVKKLIKSKSSRKTIKS